MKLKLIFIFIILSTSLHTAQSRYGYDITPSLGIPVGKEREFYKTGIGVQAGFFYDLESSTRIGLTLGYLRTGIDNDGINSFLQRNGAQGTAELEGSLTSFPILFSLRIISQNENFKLYGLIEAGLYIYWSKAEGKYITDNNTARIDESEFRSEPGMVLGIGSLFPIDDEIALDLVIKYHFVQDSEYLNNSAFNNSISTSQVITIGLGLNWNFIIQ